MKSAMLGLASWAMESLLCSTTHMKKQKPYSDSPQNSATFEYNVDLLLNRPSGPPLDTNPNDASCQICTRCIVLNCVPKKLFFLDFRAWLNKPDSAKFGKS
jgi:hypothetical protein